MLAAPAYAQERSAGQSYDAQTNWSALKASIDGLRSQNAVIAKTLDTTNKKLAALTACNAKKMIYAPADKTADADGCIAVGMLAGYAQASYSQTQAGHVRNFQPKKVPAPSSADATCRKAGYKGVIAMAESQTACGSAPSDSYVCGTTTTYACY